MPCRGWMLMLLSLILMIEKERKLGAETACFKLYWLTFPRQRWRQNRLKEIWIILSLFWSATKFASASAYITRIQFNDDYRHDHHRISIIMP
jgi:pyruvate/2-oxoacid:ferredoxin oxidoreductase beta subunit